MFHFNAYRNIHWMAPWTLDSFLSNHQNIFSFTFMTFCWQIRIALGITSVCCRLFKAGMLAQIYICKLVMSHTWRARTLESDQYTLETTAVLPTGINVQFSSLLVLHLTWQCGYYTSDIRKWRGCHCFIARCSYLPFMPVQTGVFSGIPSGDFSQIQGCKEHSQ